ncbi:MAG: glycoside hydrolase family 104 protein [Epsilonproteobacteria bacterium]|nr:glycoside hydrolase family 104 protein [Campylobacterota bacterium]
MRLTLKTIDTYLDNSNVKQMLNLLGYTEGTDRLHGYHTLVGGKRINDLSRHPNIVGIRTKYGPSTAFGRYQITYQTFQDFAKKLGIKDMSPRNQDRIAVAIMASHGALNDIVKGDFGAGIQKLGGRWASLPSSKYGQPKKSWADIVKKLSSKSLPNIEHSIYTDKNWKDNRDIVRLTENIAPVQPPVSFGLSMNPNESFYNISFNSDISDAYNNYYQVQDSPLLGLGFSSTDNTHKGDDIIGLNNMFDSIIS